MAHPDPVLSKIDQLKLRATRAAVAVSGILVTMKLGAFGLTGSVALLAAAFDSGIDCLASAINFLAVRYGLRPPDTEHRFGHGKAEAVATVAQGLFMAFSAGLIAIQSGHRLLMPEPVTHTTIGILVILASLALTFGLVLYQRRVIAETRSLVVSADELHYRSDFLLHSAVLVSLLLAGDPRLAIVDPLLALAVAAYLALGARTVILKAWSELLDREFDAADRERVKILVTAHPRVIDFHDLRTRRAGRDSFIQLHVELDPHLSFRVAHKIVDEVELAIAEAFPGAEVIVHADPHGLEDVSDLHRT